MRDSMLAGEIEKKKIKTSNFLLTENYPYVPVPVFTLKSQSHILTLRQAEEVNIPSDGI